MSGMKHSGGSVTTRRTRKIKVAPMTRAVRMALAASVAALALGASGGAFAGNCKAATAIAGDCAVARGIDRAPVADLTIVHEGAAAAAIPMVAALAIDEYGSGDVVIDNADPITEFDLFADVTTISGYSSEGNVDITNQAGADLYAGSVFGGAIGIYAYATLGDAAVDNAADITAISYYGLADGIFASGANVDVTNAGAIEVYGYTWAAGIEAQGADSTTVSNSGDITVDSAGFLQVQDYYGVIGYAPGAQAFGIYATGGEGGVDLTNSGTISVDGGYVAGIEVQSSGDIGVSNSGDIVAGSGYNASYNSDNGYYYFYGTQVATGINATSNGEGAHVGVTNSGDITAEGIFGASGIAATSGGLGGTASVDNSGDIYVSQNQKYGYGAYGIVVSADGDGAISNSGAIEVYSGGVANGAAALSFAGNASVTNSGDINVVGTATGYYGANGIVAFAGNGSAYVDNSGSVSATWTGILAASARAVDAQGQTGVSVNNSGSLYANGKYAYGVYALSSGGDVSVTNADTGAIEFYSYSGSGFGVLGLASLGDVSIDNSGSIGGYAYGQSVGIFGQADQGDVSVDNSGTVTAITGGNAAVGIFARADYGTASVDNSGDIYASVDGINGFAGVAAYGIIARGEYASVSNSGNIDVLGYDTAIGIAANSYYGSAVTNTGGSISVAALGNGTGIGAQSAYGDVMVDNASDLDVIGLYGNATGINAVAGGDASVTNSGSIYAGSLYGTSIGIYGYSVGGDVTIDNSGDLTAISYYGLADGIFASGANVDVTNAGAIEVYGYTWAAGIEAQGADSATVTNSGDINAMAAGFYQGYVYSYVYEVGGVFAYTPGGQAFGIYATAGAGGAIVGNSGDIEVQGGYATGIEVQSGGDIAVVNSGDITAGMGLVVEEYYNPDYQLAYTYYSGTLVATGINATSNGEGAHVGVSNSGDITADGIFGGTGIAATSGGLYGTASVTNTGDITASQYVGGGYGAFGIVASADGDASIDTSGAITVTSGGTGYGAAALSFAGDAVVVNSGDVSVEASTAGSKYYGSYGLLAFAGNGYAAVNNSGSVSVSNEGIAYAAARAVDAQGQQGVGVVNSGSLYADGKYAYGVFAVSTGGDVAVNNTATGEIGFYSYLGYGSGILGVSETGDVGIGNAGTIAGYGYAQGVGIFARSNGGDVEVGNTSTGSIEVVSAGTAVGIFARADYGTATVVNAGDITASDFPDTPYVGDAAYGILARGAYVQVGNSGSIVADGYYAGTGIVARSYYGTTVTTTAASDIEASAQFVAIGIEGRSEYGNVAVSNAGGIAADGAYGAVGIQAYSGEGNVAVANAGHVTADSEYGIAIGVSGYAAIGDTTVSNSGSIQAGGYIGAYGIYAGAYGDVTVNNAGTVGANAAPGGLAAGVLMTSLYGTATLNNAAAGVIGATGDEGYAWAVLGSDGVEIVNNSGRINGAVSLLGGDDVFNNRNGGVWNVGGSQSTDFGDGDDTINNLAGGAVWLDDGAIYLGAATTRNAFNNAGTIRSLGDSLVDMGVGTLANTGSITLLDGATDDSFSLVGDLGGNGNLNIDLDLAGHAADQLYVDGNMVAGAVQRVNVDFDGMPLVAHTAVAFAHVSGNSTAGSFVGGQMIGYDEPANFLDLELTVSSSLNAANTADDVFSINLDVVGLNDTGTLAANVASGAAGMLNAQVGTFKQRMGVNPYGDAGKVMSAFFRTYTSEGDVEPGHVAANFGQGGNFAYDQSVWGREVGVNANLFGNFHAGLTFGSADGRQRLTGAGVGMNRMDGLTWGWYATWLDPQGFYVDLSGRWMAVDVKSTSIAGPSETRAHTGAWNLEAGYQWTLGGLSVVPQLQYTRTEVEDVRTLHGQRADFEGHGGTSERARVGVEISKTFTAGNVRWTPYGSINAIREFDGDMTYTVADNFFGSTSTKGTSSMAELGLGVQTGGWGFTLGANWTDGGAFKSTVGGQAIVRFAW